jgi:hypothetical protein
VSGEKKWLRSIAVLAVIVAAMVAGTVGREAVRSLFNQKPDVTSVAVLSKVASDLNKTLPMAVDEETELTNVMGLEGVIAYNYRLVNLQTSDIDPGSLVQQLKPSVVKAVCTAPQTRDEFLKNGVTMRYVYTDKDRAHVASFDVTRADCGF